MKRAQGNECPGRRGLLLYKAVGHRHLRCHEQTREGATWTPGRRAFWWRPGRKGDSERGRGQRGHGENGAGPQTTAENCADMSKIIWPAIKRMTLAAEEARRPTASLCRDWTWDDSGFEQKKDEGSSEKWPNSDSILKVQPYIQWKKKVKSDLKVFGLRHWEKSWAVIYWEREDCRTDWGKEYSVLWTVPSGVLSILIVFTALRLAETA